MDMKGEIPKTVEDIMTRKLITITEDDSLETVEVGMARFRFRHLPVVRQGKLVGLITHRDMLHVSSSFLSEDRKKRDALIHKIPARRIMHTDVVTVRPSEPITKAGETMWTKKIGCLCVTDDEGVLRGIVTEADFVKLAVLMLKGK
jgi:CBS domain-containing membrane protein